ncbi:TPA: hypothetical protein VME83_000302 [Streptococcus pyogenes]|nr:hypothetical protein [Streptococcus pyogenes]
MKKTLTLLLALFAIGVTSSVRAEESSWVPLPRQQKVLDDNRNEIPVHITSNKVTVTLPPGWSAWIGKNTKQRNSKSVTNTVTLDISTSQPPKEFTIYFQGDDGFLAGTMTFIDSETLKNEQYKAFDEEYAENLFENSRLREEQKTWRDKVRDVFQDAWWNFKGLFQ